MWPLSLASPLSWLGPGSLSPSSLVLSSGSFYSTCIDVQDCPLIQINSLNGKSSFHQSTSACSSSLHSQTNYKKNVYPRPILPFLLVVTPLQQASDLIIPFQLLWPRWPVVYYTNAMDFCQPCLHLTFPWKDPGHRGYHPHHHHHPLLLTSLFSWFQRHYFSLVLLSEFSFLLVLHTDFSLAHLLVLVTPVALSSAFFLVPWNSFDVSTTTEGIHRSE